ncbi:hypothetical protein DENSPDRAFT_12169 [Dentipellis sp. KUC8613]|nr:hypothetical protein DENSPDRAFT_12169 [Dentipellis sp. KUC8613]
MTHTDLSSMPEGDARYNADIGDNSGNVRRAARSTPLSFGRCEYVHGEQAVSRTARASFRKKKVRSAGDKAENGGKGRRKGLPESGRLVRGCVFHIGSGIRMLESDAVGMYAVRVRARALDLSWRKSTVRAAVPAPALDCGKAKQVEKRRQLPEDAYGRWERRVRFATASGGPATL